MKIKIKFSDIRDEKQRSNLIAMSFYLPFQYLTVSLYLLSQNCAAALTRGKKNQDFAARP